MQRLRLPPMHAERLSARWRRAAPRSAAPAARTRPQSLEDELEGQFFDGIPALSPQAHEENRARASTSGASVLIPTLVMSSNGLATGTQGATYARLMAHLAKSVRARPPLTGFCPQRRLQDVAHPSCRAGFACATGRHGAEKVHGAASALGVRRRRGRRAVPGAAAAHEPGQRRAGQRHGRRHGVRGYAGQRARICAPGLAGLATAHHGAYAFLWCSKALDASERCPPCLHPWHVLLPLQGLYAWYEDQIGPPTPSGPSAASTAAAASAGAAADGDSAQAPEPTPATGNGKGKRGKGAAAASKAATATSGSTTPRQLRQRKQDPKLLPGNPMARGPISWAHRDPARLWFLAPCARSTLLLALLSRTCAPQARRAWTTS